MVKVDIKRRARTDEQKHKWVFLVDFYCYFFRFMYIHFHPLYNNDSIKEYTHIQHDIFYVSSDLKLQKWEFIFYQALLLWQTSNVSHTERSPGQDKKAQGYLHEKWATQVHRITTTADSSLYISALNVTRINSQLISHPSIYIPCFMHKSSESWVHNCTFVLFLYKVTNPQSSACIFIRV